MASHRSVNAPWCSFKRLRISTPSQNQPRLPKARCLTTSNPRTQDVEKSDTQTVQPEPPPTAQSSSSDAQSGTSDGDRTPRPPQGIVPQDSLVKTTIRNELYELAHSRNIPIPPSLLPHDPSTHPPPRPPKSLTSFYLAPLKRPPTHHIPVASLQLRSFSARNLEHMADFALRAAYYLNLPAKGPIPIPRITERWTVPRSHFIFKKSQENWQRITMRRVVQVLDGDPEVVRRWLGFVRRWAWHGVGMKADVWEWEGAEGLGYGEEARAKRDGPTEGEVEEALERGRWELFGRRAGLNSKDEVEKVLDEYGFRAPTERTGKKSDAPSPEQKPTRSAEASMS